MKRSLLWLGAIAVIAFVAGILAARLPTTVQVVKQQRNPPPPRTVPDNWPQIRLSPGHSQHIVNEVVKCDQCHDPTQPTFEPPDTGVCTQCHEEQAAMSHVSPDGMPMDCYTCHVFGAQPDVFGAWHCSRCHGPYQTEANPQGLSMHTTVPCENCHNPHKPISQTIRQCDDCHDKVNLKHGNLKLSGGCTGCHGGHRLATQAEACMSCHRSEQPIIPSTATFVGGHESCTNCHHPHSFTPTTASRCNDCHKGVRVLAQNVARPHRDCTSCHRPHDVRAAATSACKTCHEDISPTHPPSNKGDCVGCHQPHPARITQLALRCSQCHQEAQSDRSFHAGNTPCTGCHQPHRFDLSAIGDRALCKRCHAAQIRLTSRNMGHASCLGCHQGTVHELGSPVACASCHEDKLANSPSGHTQCLKCHEPHSGNVLPNTRCLGCHDATQLPGLHRLPNVPLGEGHTKCTVCHGIHQTRVRADRATCVTCHEDKVNHQPDAKVCSGCHTFISGKSAAQETQIPSIEGR